MEQALEGAAELDVEDRVDDRVKETVDVTEPDEQREPCWVKTTDRAEVEQVRVDEDQWVKM